MHPPFYFVENQVKSRISIDTNIKCLYNKFSNLVLHNLNIPPVS